LAFYLLCRVCVAFLLDEFLQSWTFRIKPLPRKARIMAPCHHTGRESSIWFLYPKPPHAA
jgi:hypothetical protein